MENLISYEEFKKINESTIEDKPNIIESTSRLIKPLKFIKQLTKENIVSEERTENRNFEEVKYEVLKEYIEGDLSEELSISIEGFEKLECVKNSDIIDIDIIVKDKFYFTMVLDIEDNSTQFENYLSDNFSSRDGFYSFMPNSIKKFNDDIESDENFERAISAYISYKINEDINIEVDNIIEQILDRL